MSTYLVQVPTQGFKVVNPYISIHESILIFIFSGREAISFGPVDRIQGYSILMKTFHYTPQNLFIYYQQQAQKVKQAHKIIKGSQWQTFFPIMTSCNIYFRYIGINIEKQIKQSMITQEEFVGKFEGQEFTIYKEYIDTEIPQIRLYHTKYSPPNPKYTIVIIHGFGEHSHRFKSVATFFAKNQFEVLTVDLRGFGYSGGARGCGQVRELQNDVILLLRRARSDLPLFIYAHSLGGLVTIKLLLEKSDINVSGCIITSPLLGLAKNIHFNWVKKQFIRHLGDHLSDFIVGSQVNPTALTKKKQYMHTIFGDRLMLPFMSVKMAKHIFDALDYVKLHADQFRYPVKIFHGKLDTVTDPELSRQFIYNKVRPYKEYHLFPNGFHELQHDEEKDELLQLSLEFLTKLPNLKNFGPVMIYPIPKPVHKKKPGLKLVFIIAILLFIIKKLRTYLAKA